jgi:hypothetical protein
MTLPIYDINSHLAQDQDIVTAAGRQMNFYPVVAPSSATAPYVVYYYNPLIPDPDRHWMRKDVVRYSIFDTDVERLFSVSELFIEILGKADTVAKTGGIEATGQDRRILSSMQTDSSLAVPLEKEGWYRMNLDFRICNV